jgi:hypothetical protein
MSRFCPSAFDRGIHPSKSKSYRTNDNPTNIYVQCKSIPGLDAAQVGVVGLETSRPRGSYRVAFIAFPNLRSCTRYGWLVLGEFDHFTAPVAGYRLHLCRKEISSVKFDDFRHNIIPFTGTSLSYLKSAALFDAVCDRTVSHSLSPPRRMRLLS